MKVCPHTVSCGYAILQQIYVKSLRLDTLKELFVIFPSLTMHFVILVKVANSLKPVQVDLISRYLLPKLLKSTSHLISFYN